ncbi:hypothetical protein [Nocardia nova]|uniref:hypothetical protein n=1 Tax=Nocardia nova TaxID=37330 RepID=UPI0027387C8C|nr:hypothetical protein [Nocardia nova]
MAVPVCPHDLDGANSARDEAVGAAELEKASYEQLIAELRAPILAAQQAGAATPDTHDGRHGF